MAGKPVELNFSLCPRLPCFPWSWNNTAPLHFFTSPRLNTAAKGLAALRGGDFLTQRRRDAENLCTRFRPRGVNGVGRIVDGGGDV